MADPVIVKEIGGSLRRMRLKKNISQEKLARIAGVDRTTISRMESGRAATLLTLVQVLRALDKLDILDVFREESQISPLQVLKIQERQRLKASPKRKPVKNKK